MVRRGAGPVRRQRDTDLSAAAHACWSRPRWRAVRAAAISAGDPCRGLGHDGFVSGPGSHSRAGPAVAVGSGSEPVQLDEQSRSAEPVQPRARHGQGEDGPATETKRTVGEPEGPAALAAGPSSSGCGRTPKRPVAQVRRASRRPDGPTRRDVAPAVPPTAPPSLRVSGPERQGWRAPESRIFATSTQPGRPSDPWTAVERVFSLLNMRSEQPPRAGRARPAPSGTDDLTTRARIRDAAISRFARDGFGAPSRTIAADAGVSAALVVHHFGSKDGSRRACDAYVFDAVRAAKTDAISPQDPAAGPMASFTQLAGIEDYAPVFEYTSRSLQAGGDLARSFVEHLTQVTLEYMEDGVAAGVIRPSRDEPARARRANPRPTSASTSSA
ncbi:hypothetical protein OY671_001698 [Metschnikowia pulcherrima]|nr:hypothetical protein OY671_001698 [Metschnikowia pulcherrima]